MSVENSKSPVPASAAEQQPAGATNKDDGSAAAAHDDPSSVDAAEVAQKIASNASTEPAEGLAEAVAEKTNEATGDKSDVEMTDAAAAPADADRTPAPTDEPAPDTSAAAPATGPTPSKTHAKRKSVGGATGAKAKTLSKKASKARVLHIDAQPGEHYFVKLKGFPQWPVVICDQDMLPATLLKTRPVTAMRSDGTYRDDYQDGAKKVADRTFPVMYLHTNEFGWVPNTELIDLDPETVKEGKSDKMRKDLQAAYDLAAENNDLAFYKSVLQQFQDEVLEKQKQKAAKAATPKNKKAKPAMDDEDVEMADATAADEDEDDSSPAPKKSAKKRKAEDSAEPPARAESVKKTKIKLTTNAGRKSLSTAESAPKAPKAAAATETKTAKPKTKKTEDKSETTPAPVAKEPEYTPEEKHARKEKEVLFLRHKLQKGLLTRDQEPKEEEMQAMSEYVFKLESLHDLEVSIIRATKINKVLKAILKLDNIPKEDEFQFKSRSQALLDKWNKLLTADGTAPAPSAAAPAAPASAEANGVNGAKTNGVKAKSEESDKVKEDKPAGEAEEKVGGDEKAAEPVETSA